MLLDITQFVLIIVTLFIVFFESYISEKGKNIATKKDIAKITAETEKVTSEFKKELDRFENDLNFKYDYYYQQITKLYSKLYSIICQSEYLRTFYSLAGIADFSRDTVPFIEIAKRDRKTTVPLNEIGASISKEDKVIEDDITETSKIKISQMIIEYAEFASPKLLKLAVAYRFTHNIYSGTKISTHDDFLQAANDQEILIIKEIVKTIIKEYNNLRKELKMYYSEYELDEGLFESIELGR